jgi:hypothetical protein
VVPVAGRLIPAQYWLSNQEKGTLWFYPSQKAVSTNLWLAEMECPAGITRVELAVASSAFKDFAGNKNLSPIHEVILLPENKIQPTPSPSPTCSPSPMNTFTPSPSHTAIWTPTPSRSPSPTATFTASETPVETSTATRTATASFSPTRTPEHTSTPVMTDTRTPTATSTPPEMLPDLNTDGNVNREDLHLLLQQWPERNNQGGLAESGITYEDIFYLSSWWGTRTSYLKIRIQNNNSGL